jgi:hypothetical protein
VIPVAAYDMAAAAKDFRLDDQVEIVGDKSGAL